MPTALDRPLCGRRADRIRPARSSGLGGVLGAEDAHHDEVFPAVRIEFGFPADSFTAEAAGQVAVDGTAIAGHHLQLDPVHAQHIKRPGQHQPGHLTAQPPAAQGGDKQAHRVFRGVLTGVHVKTGAADAVAVVFDHPGIGAGICRGIGDGQILAGVVAAAIPLPPPRRAVAVFFLGVDGMAHPIIHIVLDASITRLTGLGPRWGRPR